MIKAKLKSNKHRSKYTSGPKKGWSKADEDELRTLAMDHTDDEIAELTDRTYSSIMNKRQALGIAKFARQDGTRKRTVSSMPKLSKRKPLSRVGVIARNDSYSSGMNLPKPKAFKEAGIYIRVDNQPLEQTLSMLVDAVNHGYKVEVA